MNSAPMNDGLPPLNICTELEEAMGDSAMQEFGGESESGGRWHELFRGFQKSASIGVNLQRWRKASLAINACNRMRLVLESNHPVIQERAAQVAIDISSPLTVQLDGLFNVPTTHEAIWQDEHLASSIGSSTRQNQNLPPCFGFSTEEQSHSHDEVLLSLLLRRFHIVERTLTNDGRLIFAIESMQMDSANIRQTAKDFCALFEGSQDLEALDSYMGTVPSPSSDDKEWLSSLPMLPWDNEDFQPGSFDEMFGNSSANGAMSGMDVAIELDGASQNNPLTPDSAVSMQLWDTISNMPLSQGNDASNYMTPSDNTSMWEEEADATGRVENSDLDETTQRGQSLKDLTPKLVEDIFDTFQRIDQASDRTKLESLKVEIQEHSVKSHGSIRTFEKHVTRLFDDVRKSVEKVPRVLPAIRQEIEKAITTVFRNFKEKELKQLVEESRKISKKFEKIAEQLGYREVSAIKVYQNVACLIKVIVESFLEKHSSNFVHVGELSNWCRKDGYNLSHLRLDVGSRGVR